MNKIIELQFGSHLYGTNTPESDKDYKAIYIPTAKEIVLGNYKQTINETRSKKNCERNTKDDVDMEILSLDRFLKLLSEGQVMAIDILFAPRSFYTNSTQEGLDIMDRIYNNRHRIINKNVNAFIGYAKMQAARYGIKGSRMDSLKRVMHELEACDDERKKLNHYAAHFANLVDSCNKLVSLEKTPLVEIVLLKGPTGLIDQEHLHVNGRYIPFHATVKYAKEIVSKMLDGYGARATKAHLANGIDYKALSHAVRVNNEAIELLLTKNVTFPRPEAQLLKDIKLGNIPYEQVATIIEEGLAELVSIESDLPESADQEWIDNFIYEIYSKEVINENSSIK